MNILHHVTWEENSSLASVVQQVWLGLARGWYFFSLLAAAKFTLLLIIKFQVLPLSQKP